MPLLQITDAEKLEAYASVSDELRYLFEEHEVPKNVVEVLGHLHVRKLNVFARLEPDETGLRRFLLEDVGLDGAGRNRALIATLIGCWEAAREKAKKVTEHAAAAQLEGRPKELLRSAHIDLRKSLEAVIDRVPDAEYPSYQYLNLRFDQMEEGEFRAEQLDEIVSFEAELKFGGDDFTMDFTKAGGMKLRRQRLKGTTPGDGDTEALRTKYRLMTHHWLVVRLRHPNHRALHDLTDRCWDSHVKCLLGEEVLGLTCQDDAGAVIGRLSWRAFLRFEWESRHWMMNEVNMGRLTLSAAIKQVRNDQLLRTKYVITPLATSGAAAARSRPSSSNEPAYNYAPEPKRRKKGDNKGKPKGGGRTNPAKEGGKGPKNPKAWKMNIVKRWECGMKFATAVCYNFNKQGCTTSGCKYTHACAYCGATEHGVETCAAFNKLYNSTQGGKK